jgi:DNA-binding PadR family transcriptional regulator
MKKIEEVFEMVEKVAASRPRHSNNTFLPRQIPELAVLTLLEKNSLSGDVIIRQLSPINRHAAAFGVSYKLLHDLEGTGNLAVSTEAASRRRTYRLTEKGAVRLHELRATYALAPVKDWQTDFNFNLVNSLNLQPVLNQQVA